MNNSKLITLSAAEVCGLAIRCRVGDARGAELKWRGEERVICDMCCRVHMHHVYIYMYATCVIVSDIESGAAFVSSDKLNLNLLAAI